MKRSAKITLEYTKEEMAIVLQSAIANAEKVSVESMKYEDGKFILNCVEGINTIPQTTQVSKISFDSLIPTQKKKYTLFGMGKVIKDCLAGDVKCPIDILQKELELKGFKLTTTKLRTYLVVRKELYNEVEPNVFKLV